MMYHIPAVLSSQEVDDFIAQLQQAEWVDGRVTTGDLGARSKITSRLIPTAIFTANFRATYWRR